MDAEQWRLRTVRLQGYNWVVFLRLRERDVDGAGDSPDSWPETSLALNLYLKKTNLKGNKKKANEIFTYSTSMIDIGMSTSVLMFLSMDALRVIRLNEVMPKSKIDAPMPMSAAGISSS